MSVPAKIGDYQIRRVISEGASAYVVEAVDQNRRLWAIKIFKGRPTQSLLQTIRSEAMTLRRLDSDRVAKFFEIVESEDHVGLVMEFVPGKSLHDMRDDIPLRGLVFKSFADALISALKDIHNAGLIHRDLKPHNVIFGEEGVKIVDFGLSLGEVEAAAADSDASGTPIWISPEQAQGAGETRASDIFNLGLLLAYAASGQHPFGSGGTDAVLFRILKSEPNLNLVPPHMRGPIEACLAKEPDKRPDLDTLKIWLSGSTSASGEEVILDSGATVFGSQTVLGRAANGFDVLSDEKNRVESFKPSGRKRKFNTALITSFVLVSLLGIASGVGSYLVFGQVLTASGPVEVNFKIDAPANPAIGKFYLEFDNDAFREEFAIDGGSKGSHQFRLTDNMAWSLDSQIRMKFTPSFSQDEKTELVVDPRQLGLTVLNDQHRVIINIEVGNQETRVTLFSPVLQEFRMKNQMKSSRTISRNNERQARLECDKDQRTILEKATLTHRNANWAWENIYNNSKLNASGSLLYTTWASRATTAINDGVMLQLELIANRAETDGPIRAQQTKVENSLEKVVDAVIEIRTAARAESATRWSRAWDRYWDDVSRLRTEASRFSFLINNEVRLTCDELIQ